MTTIKSLLLLSIAAALLLLHGAARAQNPDGLLHANLSCDKLAGLTARAAARNARGSAPAPARVASYGPARAQSLEVHLPAKHAGAAPIIMMVHGGAWCVGDKGTQSVVANKAARWLPRGFVFVSINYRMLPDKAGVLTQADDVARAVAYVQSHAARWGGDPSRIILMGHSAGAHLVSLLSSDPALAARQGAKPWLGTVSLDTGALDAAPAMRGRHAAFYDDAFGSDPSFWTQASPLRRLTQSALPWFGVCSTRRASSCKQAYLYAEALKQYGIDAGVLPLDMTHGEINAKLGEPGDYTSRVEDFMKSLDPQVERLLNRPG